jgi:hypothetical protein
LLIMLAAWGVLYMPFWEGPETLQALAAQTGYDFYLHTFAEVVLQHAPSFVANIAPWFGVQDTGPEFTAGIISYLRQNLPVWLLLASAAAAIAVTWRARTFERALTAWGWVAFAALLGHTYFWPWYAVWLIAPAALTRSMRLRNTTFVFCCSVLLQYACEAVLMRHFSIFGDLKSVLIVAPPLVYLGFSWWLDLMRRRRNRRSTKPAVVWKPSTSA